MARIQKTVFISYRRADIGWALAIFKELTHHGYDVFIDYDGLASGNFETAILENVKARAHFLPLLTATALERSGDPKDWMRREIEAALDSKRNIVPLMLDGFKFDTPVIASQLAGKLETLKKYHGLEIAGTYFDAAMERLRNKFLNVPVDAVLHSASVSAQQAATEQQDKAERALGQEIQPLRSADLLTGPLTIGAVLKGAEHQLIGDAYPTGDHGVHFVFSVFNASSFDFLVHQVRVDVLAYTPLNLDYLKHGVGATDVKRYFRAKICPELGSYVATYVSGKHQGEFVTIPPGKSEAFDVEITTPTEGLYDVGLRLLGGSAGKGFDVSLDSWKRRVAFFDRAAGYMVDRGLGGRLLTYEAYSLEMNLETMLRAGSK
jgi:hypothetical protein